MSFQFACQEDQVEAASGIEITLSRENGEEITLAVIRDEDGGWHALDAMCTHGEVNLFDCDVEACSVECWGHGAVFDLETGVGSLPATENLHVYPVKNEAGKIYVDPDAGVKN